MPFDVTLLTLLHILVFVYWLGGDLGAFYASSILTDPERSVSDRALAGKVLADIDMAPRTSLLLAAPTGLALANTKGWLSVDWIWVSLIFLIATCWIFLVWRLHLQHDAQSPLKKIDILLRVILLIILIGAGSSGLINVTDLPLFLSLKLLALSFAIILGLIIRQKLVPFGPAFVQMVSSGATEESDEVIREAVAGAKPFVLLIWATLILAAFLGIAIPA